ncbi:MAG TPA: helix-turn-helix domain-containing protein [Polyangiaceae bacterium]|nr:helix-turn-helix domain-containing protein [Polyangiaceae bacterium]
MSHVALNEMSVRPLPYLTSHDAARLASVSPSTVLSWVNRGLLPAHRTPGGHRRIERSALARFLREHSMPVPPDLASITRLLVMDSDATFLRSVHRLLKRAAPDLSVETGEGAIDGLLKIGVFQPDAVILDALLPEIDAVEICRRVRQNPATANIMIIPVASHPTPKTRAAFAEVGAAELLMKPLDAAALLGALGLEPDAWDAANDTDPQAPDQNEF